MQFSNHNDAGLAFGAVTIMFGHYIEFCTLHKSDKLEFSPGAKTLLAYFKQL